MKSKFKWRLGVENLEGRRMLAIDFVGEVSLVSHRISAPDDGAGATLATDIDGDGDTDVLASLGAIDELALFYYHHDSTSPARGGIVKVKLPRWTLHSVVVPNRGLTT